MGKCKHCNKNEGDHQAKTLACPIGKKTRIGYIAYDTENTFTPKRNNTKYKLIPFNEITKEAKRIAVIWGDAYFPGVAIIEKHKLASDIMNYAKGYTKDLEDRIKELESKI